MALNIGSLMSTARGMDGTAASVATSGAAMRARARKERAEARKVVWLITNCQRALAHHTAETRDSHRTSASPLHCPGCEALHRRVEALEVRLRQAQEGIQPCAAAVSSNNKDLKEATGIQEKEAKNFAAEGKELIETVGMTKRAIGILEREMKGGADMPPVGYAEQPAEAKIEQPEHEEGNMQPSCTAAAARIAAECVTKENEIEKTTKEQDVKYKTKESKQLDVKTEKVEEREEPGLPIPWGWPEAPPIIPAAGADQVTAIAAPVPQSGDDQQPQDEEDAYAVAEQGVNLERKLADLRVRIDDLLANEESEPQRRLLAVLLRDEDRLESEMQRGVG